MSEKQISIGDVVRVVKVHCDTQWLNHIFQVTAITHGNRTCIVCGHIEENDCATGLSYFHMPLHWLSRIPPLSELEGERIVKRIPYVIEPCPTK